VSIPYKVRGSNVKIPQNSLSAYYLELFKESRRGINNENNFSKNRLSVCLKSEIINEHSGIKKARGAEIFRFQPPLIQLAII
jgi:hypothetical protein